MPDWRIGILFMFLLGVCTFKGYSQTPYFTQYTISNGLPSTIVYDVFQDNDGYIWFGTEVGVSRFDGREFVNYSIQDGLTDSEVFTIFQDSKDRIWFLTFNGKICFYHHGKIYNPSNTPFLSNIHSSDSVLEAIEDEDGAISFLSSQEGIKTLHNNNTVSVNASAGMTGVQSIWYDHQKRINQLSSKVIRIDNDKFDIRLDPVDHDYLLKGFETQDHHYVSFNKSINIFSKADGSHKRIAYDFLTSNIIRVYVDQAYFWLGTNDGIYRINRFDDSDYLHLLKGKKVSGIYQDVEDNYWFSTLGYGVFFCPNLEVINIDETDGLFSSRINDLEFDKDHTLWIATSNDGVATYANKEVNAWQITGQVSQKTTRVKFIGDTTYILNKAYIMEFVNGKQRSLYQNASDVLMDKSRRLWVASRSVRIFDYNLMAQHATTLWDKEKSINIHSTQRINCMIDMLAVRANILLQDNNDNIYIGGTTGFFKVISSEKQPVVDTIRIIPEDIVHMDFDPKRGTFWISSKTNGVYAVQNDKVIHHITAADGLSATSCHAIKIENERTIWVGTIRGLNRLVIDENEEIQISNYSFVSGKGSNKINTIEVDNTNIFLGTDEGLTIVPKSALYRSPHPPKILPIEVYIDGEIVMSQGMKFDHDQNDVSIDFTGFSYADYGRLTYKYRLLGADEQWHSTTLQGAKYPQLPPGKYQFEVKAINTAGLSSVNTSSFSFEITIPYWRTLAFQIITASSLLFIILLIYWNRIKQLKIRHNYENKLVQTENEKLELERNNSEQRLIALRAQMNPHFLFNALNTIKGYYTAGQNRTANLLISKFASLLRLILDYSDQSIPLDKEIHLIQSYLSLSASRHVDAFEYKVTVADEIDITNTAIPSMLIQPLIENAIIHGVLPKDGNGLIEVDISTELNNIIVAVTDNGMGLESNNQSNFKKDKKSKGLSIVKEQLSRIAEKHNIEKPFAIKTLVDPNGDVAGTEVIIKIPMHSIW